MQPGDTLLMPAGTIYALGPGILTYEVQQSSDLTYRTYDWDRPLVTGRSLHLQEAAQFMWADLHGQVTPPTVMGIGAYHLASCAYFQIDLLFPEDSMTHRTDGDTFHILTVTHGTVQLNGAGGPILHRFETVLMPV